MCNNRPFRPYDTRSTSELRYIKLAYDKIGEPAPLDLELALIGRREPEPLRVID